MPGRWARVAGEQAGRKQLGGEVCSSSRPTPGTMEAVHGALRSWDGQNEPISSLGRPSRAASRGLESGSPWGWV